MAATTAVSRSKAAKAKKSGKPGVIQHSAKFRQRRAGNWLTLGFTYAAMYVGRYNFPLANKALSDHYGFSTTQLGFIISAASLVYGFSALFNGPIADKLGGRKAMLIGAWGAFAFNLIFGAGAYLGILGKGSLMLGYFAMVWALNMYFQSYSALALIKVNAAWFHISERGVFSAIFGTIIQFGRALVFGVGFVVLATLPWQWIFFVPAAILAVMGTLTFKVVQDGPEHCGFAPFDVQDASSGDKDKVSFSYVVRKVFTNPVTLTIAIAEFCTGFVRTGFEQWFPRYMIEVKSLPITSWIFQKDAFAIVLAGVAGAFVAGMASDWLFKARRTPVAFIGYALQIICLGVVWLAPSLGWIVAAFIFNSMGISMVHSMLSGTASMDFGGKKAAATAAGLFDGMQYIGGGVMGYTVGWLIDPRHFGWKAWAPSMIGFSMIGAILMLILWNAKPKAAGSH